MEHVALVTQTFCQRAFESLIDSLLRHLHGGRVIGRDGMSRFQRGLQ